MRDAPEWGVGEPGRPEREPGRGHCAQGPGRAGARSPGTRGTDDGRGGPRKGSRSQTKRFAGPGRGTREARRAWGADRVALASERDPGRGRGAGSRRAVATYLLIRDPLRLLQAEGAAKGAVLGHHAQAAGGAHQLLGVAARGHLGGHDAATAFARGPGPRPVRSPAPPAWMTTAASNRHARPGERANRYPGPAPTLSCSIHAVAPPRPLRGPTPIGSEGPPRHAPPPSGGWRLWIGQLVCVLCCFLSHWRIQAGAPGSHWKRRL